MPKIASPRFNTISEQKRDTTKPTLHLAAAELPFSPKKGKFFPSAADASLIRITNALFSEVNYRNTIIAPATPYQPNSRDKRRVNQVDRNLET